MKTKGAPTKYNKETKRQIEIMAKCGMTDAQMADVLGIHEDTLNNWKKRYPTFFKDLEDWKSAADKQVERTLFQRACGYEHPEEKIMQYEGKVIRVETVKKYPPDTTAIIFWLKNRMKKQWRDVQDHKHGQDPDNPLPFIEVRHVGTGCKKKDNC